MLNLLCGLLKPTSGRIFFGDDDVTDLPAENRGGLLFIGSENVLSVPGVADQPVYAAVRPEGFLLCEDGPLSPRVI